MLAVALALVTLGAGAVPAADPMATASLMRAVTHSHEPAAIRFELAARAAMRGNRATALSLLRSVAATGGLYDPSRDIGDRFASLARDPSYRQLLATIHHTHPPVSNSRLVTIVHAPSFITEDVAYDRVSRAFYVGSIPTRQIVRVDRFGAVTTFVPPQYGGIGKMLGMRLLQSGRTLWVVANRDDASGLYVFSLATGRLIRRVMLPHGGQPHLFNDLLVTPAHDAYITDSNAGVVYRVARDGHAFVVVMRGLLLPNGITQSTDGRAIYVSTEFEGVYRYDAATASVALLPHAPGIAMASIDGLYSDGRYLAGVQNGYGIIRAVRFTLNAAGTAVIAEKTLEYNTPAVSLPTEGCIDDGTLYFVGNSQLDRWDGHRVRGSAPLVPIHVYAVRYRPSGA